jgi:hypothetical protein
VSAVRALVVSVGLAVALVVAGCGGSDTVAPPPSTTSTTTTMPAPTKPTTVPIYFLRGDQVWPVARHIPSSSVQATWEQALFWLTIGPTKLEKANLQLTDRYFPAAVKQSWSPNVSYMGGVVRMDQREHRLSGPALAQVVYTLTGLPDVRRLVVDGRRVTRAQFEEQTPPILIESPLSGATVTSPIRVKGTANTFEATFQYELRDAAGKILSKHFEMATSGSGTRGTFDFTVPFTVDRKQLGKLVLYEDSAEDGSRIHVQEIPLVLSP